MHRAVAVVLVLFVTSAEAHPGHAVADLWHLLTEPDHLAMILLALAVAVWPLRPLRRPAASNRRRREP